MFERSNNNPLRTLRIGKSIQQELEEHPICISLNGSFKDILDVRDPNIQVWINPSNQISFKSGWCTEQDLRDWMNGKGILIKGDTQEEKNKYWKYAVANSNKTNQNN